MHNGLNPPIGIAPTWAALMEDPPPTKALNTVGFKLSEGMELPTELASQFKFARQKSKLAGTIRGSYFDFKNEY